MSATACCRDGGGQEKIEDTEGNASQRIDQHHRHDAKAQKRAPWHALELQLCGSLTSRVVRKRGWSIYHSGPDPASVYRFPEIFLDASFVYLFICGEFRLQNHVLWSFSMQLIDRSMLLLLHSRSLSLSRSLNACVGLSIHGGFLCDHELSAGCWRFWTFFLYFCWNGWRN